MDRFAKQRATSGNDLHYRGGASGLMTTPRWEHDRMTDEVVHSGLMPSCETIGEGATIAFVQDQVTCPDCLECWRKDGLPKFLRRTGETQPEFLARTGQA